MAHVVRLKSIRKYYRDFILYNNTIDDNKGSYL